MRTGSDTQTQGTIAATSLVAAALCVAVATTTSCSSITRGRSGAAFTKSFPDPVVLLTTEEPVKVRRVLVDTPLPSTNEHHQDLLNALDRADAFDTEHLLLLTEAVSLPDRVADVTKQRQVPFARIGDRIVAASGRGLGPYAGVIDQILLRGAPRVTDPGPENFGRLIDATQDPGTQRRLFELLVRGPRAEAWDDGSVDHLMQMLGAITAPDRRAAFCADVLVPGDRLAVDQVYAAATLMEFDSSRLRLLEADYARRRSLPVQDVLAHLELMRFDSARVQLARAASRIVERMDAEAGAAIIAAAHSDNSRSGMVAAIGDKIALNDAADAVRVVSRASFDAGREAMLSELVTDEFPQLDPGGLVDLVSLAQFDGGRSSMLRMLSPRLKSPMTAAAAKRLLATYEFDAGRNAAIDVLADRLADVPVDDRAQVLEPFTYDSARERARDRLRW